MASQQLNFACADSKYILGIQRANATRQITPRLVNVVMKRELARALGNYGCC